MNDMNEDNKQLAASVESEAGNGVASGNLVARRRLLMGAGAAAPIVLTMASMPAHANGACINPSGFISAATYASRHPGGVPPVCTTNGPSYWKALDKTLWPGYKAATATASEVNTQTKKFKNVFGGSNTATLISVLTNGKEFEKYCVAAFLNASKGGIANFPLSVAQSKGLYTTIVGGVLPTGAVKPTIPVTTPPWNEAKAVDWLKIVMG